MKKNIKIIFLIAFILILLFNFSIVFANAIIEPKTPVFPTGNRKEKNNNESVIRQNKMEEVNTNKQTQNQVQNNAQMPAGNQINVNTNENTNNNMQENKEVIPEKQKTELLSIKNKSRTKLEKYQEQYNGNKLYGTIAYILSIARVFSIPIFVVGILLSVVYEFIIGLKKRDLVNKGRGMRITFGVAFIIFQTLPLIFSIVIKFWG